MPQISNLRLLFSPVKPSFLKPKSPFLSLFNTISSSSSPKRPRIIFNSRSLGGYRSKSNSPFRETNKKSSRDKDGDNGVGMEKERDNGGGSLGFNRKRAEGDRSDKPRKILKVKDRKLNPTNTIAYVQILGTGMDTQDTSPSVLLFFDKQRFIFNAGEGLQRFCTEHKIKLSKIDYIFLSRVCSETAGGLPGLLLTLAGMGDEGMAVNVWGPSDLQYLVHAMRSFIPGAAMVHTNEFGSNIPESKKFAAPIEIITNEVVKISAILLRPRSLEASATKPGDTSVIYLCELPELMGKFDPEKAKALGLKPGPKYRALQSGESVKSDRMDIMVHPSDVMGPSVPGPIVLLLDCPTESHAQELLSVQSLNNYYSDFSGSPPESVKTVDCIIHLSPASAVSSPSYQMWMKKFGSSQHIMAGHEMKNVEIPILKSSARVAARLNYLCPQFFPSPGFWSLKHLNIPKDSGVSSEISREFHPLVTTSAENLLKFTLRPHANLGLDKSNIPSSTSSSETIDELLAEIPEIVDAAQHVCNLWSSSREQKMDVTPFADRGIIEEPWLKENHLPSCLDNIRRDDLEIVLLGTGSSQPSKYRNVSSIYINLFSKGSLLLDCGEGTLGQLRRRYGLEGANDALRNLKCVWISHIHADHHTGLARILASRRELLKDSDHEQVLVVGPRQLKGFLVAYQSLEDLDMQFIDCRSTTNDSWNVFESTSEPEKTTLSPGSPKQIEDQGINVSNASSNLFARGSSMQSYWTRPGSPVDNHMAFRLLKSLKKVLSDAGLEALISFPVVHCPQAYGIVLRAAERNNSVGKVIPGWKIVYSGDTRPCPELVEASHGATVLIHEATFENDLVEEAMARNHSTTKEAIEVGDSAGAYRIILTHFSQRYPKVPVFDDTHMHKTCIAFDLMSVNIADLPMLPRVLPYLKILFRNEMTVDELDDVLAAVSSAS